MKCPYCKSEVVDWHFYCPNCHALVNDYDPQTGKTNQGLVERVGKRLLDLIIALFIIGLLVMMARAIRWGDFFDTIREEVTWGIAARGDDLPVLNCRTSLTNIHPPIHAECAHP